MTRVAAVWGAFAFAWLAGLGCAPGVPAGLEPATRALPGDAPGPEVGSVPPAFELPDQDGRVRRLEELRGSKGLLLNFNRSVVW